MQTWRQRWRFWRHRLPDVVVSLLAVLVMTRYAATKPTNQLQNSGIVLLRSGGVEAGITAEDVGRGYAVSLARTNETCSFAMPAGAEEARRWRIRGASSDWIAFDAGGWSFPVGTNSASAFCVDSSGRVDAFAGAVCGQPLASFLPVNAPLGVVPEANWRLLPESARPSRFWHHLTPSNTLQFTWENALLGRAAANPVSFQVELSGTGAFVYRYDLTRVAAPDTNLFASAVFGSSANPAIALFPGSAVPQSRCSVSFYPLYPSDLDDPDPDGDGISTADEIRVHGTDPHLADTDEDGLSDYDELFVHGTDPLDPHSLGGPGSDGLAARLAGENPFAFPDGSTNTVYEHVFYSGTTNGPVAFPQPTENFAILRVGVSGDGEGDLMVGDRVYPLLPPPRLRSGAATNTLLVAVGRGRRERLWWRRPDGLDVALNSEDFMVGVLPSLCPGWIAFPFTDATIPCIHRLSDRSVRVRLVTGFPDMTATWSSGSADVVVTNLPPDAAKITGRFDADEERAVVYTVWHPDRLAGQTNYTQSVRFCPNKPPPRGESPDVTEGESHYVMCKCSESVSGICRCDCAIYGHEWNMMCDCGDDCAYANPPEMTGDEEAAAGDDYEAAVVLQPLEGVLHLYGDNADQVHLDVPVGALVNCCPCPEHTRSNYVSAAYSSSRLEVLESNDVFRISYRPCDVTVRGVAPSRSCNDASVLFSTNGGWYIWRDYTVLGLKLDTPGDLPPIEVYNRLSPSLGFPATVTTNEYLAAALILRNDLLLADGVVRVAVENAAGDVRVCFAGSENYYADPETVLDTAFASERFFPIRHWYRLVRRHDWELGNVRMLVMASEPGAFDLVVEYAGAVGGKSVRDVARQRVTAIRPPLMADYNRDGGIDLADVAAYLDGSPFRYWVNDCRVKGSVWEEPSLMAGIAPGLSSPLNRGNLKVDGAYDLLNFFPVAVRFEPFFSDWGHVASFRVSTDVGISEFNCTLAEIPHLKAGEMRTAPHVDVFGDPLTNATLVALDHSGISLSNAQAGLFDTNSCLLVVESKYSGYSGIRFSVFVAGTELYSFWLPVCTSSVDDMYRFVNIRGAQDGELFQFAANTPWNSPDDELADKDVFFVHGFNVDLDGARNWNREMFKRLWVSGMNARYWGVTWDGDYHALPLVGDYFNGLHYHRDVRQALMTAPTFRNLVNSNGVDAVVIGHSLGNMVVSEALLTNMNARTYIMLDAAVASEAYRPELQADGDAVLAKYRPGDWAGYDSLSWAANWYTWFTNTPNDAHADIGWAGHFAPLLERPGLSVYNFYSSGDEVFEENSETPGITTGVFHWPTLNLEWPFVHLNWELDAFPWQKQEVLKGVDMAGSLSAGWGFHCWMTNRNDQMVTVKYSAAEANALVANGTIPANAVFDRGVSAMFSSMISDYDKADILAFHIPAVSSPAGKVAVFNDNDAVDMNVNCKANSWGRQGVQSNDGQGQTITTFPWLHSDIKNMAYYYVYPAFTNIVDKGSMK